MASWAVDAVSMMEPVVMAMQRCITNKPAILWFVNWLPLRLRELLVLPPSPPTVTEQRMVDVYCYSCDEERVDPDLEKHLELLGINLAERTKTEKSLAELVVLLSPPLDLTLSMLASV